MIHLVACSIFFRFARVHRAGYLSALRIQNAGRLDAEAALAVDDDL